MTVFVITFRNAEGRAWRFPECLLADQAEKSGATEPRRLHRTFAR